MKIALAQIDPTIGDIVGNTAMILDRIAEARSGGASLVVFPELALFGYPPMDLVNRRDLIQGNVRALDQIASCCGGITAVVGFVRPNPADVGKGLFNAAAVCRDGRILATYAKRLLPTYDVFHETRHFSAGTEVGTVSIPVDGGRITIGITICEDLWHDRQFDGRRVYGVDPVRETVAAGADVLINLSASPYRVGIQAQREELFADQIREHRTALVYVNQIGGNDDLVFDGASLVIDGDGRVTARAKAFAEDLLFADVNAEGSSRKERYPNDLGSMHDALVLGVRDYMRKCGFHAAVVGLSGGIDSAVTAALAVEAIGPDSVAGVAMPSRYSSDHSVEDARKLAENLGIDFCVIPIEGAHRAMEEAVAPQFAKARPSSSSVADENIQARIRGNILMALSNRFGSLLLSTGNKSELAVGYCTLYGDMCGGLAVLSDVPKTVVYQLADHINATTPSAPIPVRTIRKAPSAELREDQTDQDTLPPYDVLDAILEGYVERENSIEELLDSGFERETVMQVVQLVDRNEYKRKQSAVGLKVTSRAFGTGRRMPIAARCTVPEDAS